MPVHSTQYSIGERKNMSNQNNLQFQRRGLDLCSPLNLCVYLYLYLPLPFLLPLVDTGSLLVGFKLINLLILVSDRTKMNSFS